MTTFLYTTTSTTAAVSDARAVAEVLESDEYWFTVEPVFDEDAGTLSFNADAVHTAFDVYESSEKRVSVTESFFEELAPYIDGEFVVKCMEVQGDGEPTVWKWVVSSDGTVNLIDFDRL
jgi:hypothetical protein